LYEEGPPLVFTIGRQYSLYLGFGGHFGIKFPQFAFPKSLFVFESSLEKLFQAPITKSVGLPLVGKGGLLPDLFLALITDNFHIPSLASVLLTPQRVEAER